MPDRPKVVTLCGSTRFVKEFLAEQQRLTFAGNIVLSVGCFGHQIGLDMKGELKERLDELHLRKIDMSDEVHVINAKRLYCERCAAFVEPFTTWPGECPHCWGVMKAKPYVGESTRREIEYAKARNIPVTYLNPPEG